MEQNYWQNRYDESSTAWDIGNISTPLKCYFDQLEDKSKRILIPGCGFGHEAIYLSKQGFTDVTALDFVREALVNISNEATNVKTICADIFDLDGTFDLIIEQTMFCALHPSLREAYLAKIDGLLSENGKFVGVMFNKTFESGPPFGGTKEEYLVLFQKYFSDVKITECYNSIEPRKGSELFMISKK